MKTQEQIQTEAVNALMENNGGTVHILTGGGKSKIAIDYIMKTAKPYQTVLITVPLTRLIDNWKSEFNKFTLCGERDGLLIVTVPNGYITINIETIQTAYKDSKKYNYLVVDEIHTTVTPEYSKIFDNEYSVIVGLTATPDNLRREDKQMLYDKHCPIIYEYLEGESDGVVNKIKFYIVEHVLDNNFKFKAGNKSKSWLVGEAKHYEYLTSQIKLGQTKMAIAGSTDFFGDAAKWFWNKEGSKEEQEAARIYLQGITKRRKFLVSLNSTAEISKTLAKRILSESSDNKVLVFSEEVAQLHKICKYNIYGEQDESKNAAILNDFNTGDIKAVGSCYTLTLGINLVGANNAIIESYNGSDTKSTQRIGRLHRLEKSSMANIYIVKVLGTQSESWFNDMMRGYDLSDAEIISSTKILTT